jgi:hypothetical protein
MTPCIRITLPPHCVPAQLCTAALLCWKLDISAKHPRMLQNTRLHEGHAVAAAACDCLRGLNQSSSQQLVTVKSFAACRSGRLLIPCRGTARDIICGARIMLAFTVKHALLDKSRVDACCAACHYAWAARSLVDLQGAFCTPSARWMRSASISLKA